MLSPIIPYPEQRHDDCKLGSAVVGWIITRISCSLRADENVKIMREHAGGERVREVAAAVPAEPGAAGAGSLLRSGRTWPMSWWNKPAERGLGASGLRGPQ